MRFTPDEAEAIDRQAKASGLGFASLVRACIRIALAVPTDEEGSVYDFARASDQLARVGNNLNQIAYRINKGQVRITDEDRETMREMSDAVRNLHRAFVKYQELADRRDLSSKISDIEI